MEGGWRSLAMRLHSGVKRRGEDWPASHPDRTTELVTSQARTIRRFSLTKVPCCFMVGYGLV